MEELEFVRLGSGDEDAVWELERLSFGHPWTIESYRHELCENKLAYYYGCRSGGRLLAFAGCWLLVDEAHITNIATHPNHRRRGIAEWMLTRMSVEVMRLGGSSMTLEVRSHNEPALALYRKLGFVSAGLRKGYYDDPDDDAVIMWWHLHGQDKTGNTNDQHK